MKKDSGQKPDQTCEVMFCTKKWVAILVIDGEAKKLCRKHLDRLGK